MLLTLQKAFKARIRHPQKKKNNKTSLCFAYDSDLEQMYAFYCARYENITFKDFLDLGITDFMMKLNSIPESEPLYNIIKSRVINISNIKDKNESVYEFTLKFLDIDLMIEATENKATFCKACFDGDYPVKKLDREELLSC